MSIDEKVVIEEYNSLRYLRFLNIEQLNERLALIANNLWSTDKDGSVIATFDNKMREGFIILYIHTLLEKAIKTETDDIAFDEEKIRKDATANYIPPSIVGEIDFNANCIAKFGKIKHLQPSLEKGFFRIAPSKSYDDVSLNPAQKDDELEHIVRTPNENLMINLYTNDQSGNREELDVELKELFRYMILPDSYVWCCASRYDARLFGEFEADAALIITNFEEFSRKLTNAVEKKIEVTDKINQGVSYYDPFTTIRENLIPGFSKHFKYFYQNEHRFLWSVKNPIDLKPFIVEIGPLYDIAKIIRLS